MLFKSEELQKQLRRDGYVVIPFLDKAQVARLNAFYKDVHHDEEPPGFIDDIHMTTWCKDRAYKDEVAAGLMDIFDAPSKARFKNFRRLNNVFIVKKSGKSTTFKVHQDWNVVDENRYESVNVWVPLHDVDAQSGALWVLKGSHRICRRVRGAGYLFPDYGPFYEALEKKAVSVKLKAGEAIVFYHSVIHGSPPNLAGGLRKAACFSIIPKEAPLCIYFQPKAGEPLRRYRPADDFMYQYEHLRTESFHRPPAAEPEEELEPYVTKKVELAELDRFMKRRLALLSFLDRWH